MYERGLGRQESSRYEEIARAIEVTHDSIGEATLLLKDWHKFKDVNNIHRQELLARQHRQACEKLSLMVRGSKLANLEVSIRLSDKSEPVITHFIKQVEPNFYRAQPEGELSPGNGLLLNREISLLDEKTQSKKIYFGNEQRYLEVSGIAEALVSGGALVISAPEPALH